MSIKEKAKTLKLPYLFSNSEESIREANHLNLDPKDVLELALEREVSTIC